MFSKQGPRTYTLDGFRREICIRPSRFNAIMCTSYDITSGLTTRYQERCAGSARSDSRFPWCFVSASVTKLRAYLDEIQILSLILVLPTLTVTQSAATSNKAVSVTSTSTLRTRPKHTVLHSSFGQFHPHKPRGRPFTQYTSCRKYQTATRNVVLSAAVMETAYGPPGRVAARSF